MASAFDIAARGADSAYKVRQVNEERRKGQFDNSFISQALEKYNDPNDPASYNQTVNQILTRVSPQKAKGVLDQLGSQEKQKQQSSQIQQLGDYYESQGENRNLAYAPDSVQAQKFKPAQRDALAEKVQFDIYKDAQKKTEQGQSHNDLLGELNNMRSLSTKFQGPGASVSARILGTDAHAASSQFEASSNLILEPVFKLYNPSGPLPQRKVEMLRTLLKPNWNDTQPVIDAKLNAIERLVKGKSSQSKRASKLLSKYGSNIPAELYYAIDDEDDGIIEDVYQDALKINKKDDPFGGAKKGKSKTGTLDDIWGK